MRDEPSDFVVVHPLLVENSEVLIMPEVTRVLRIVFQVLSQPNYYLSKSGISSRRLSGPHLMKLKILGIVNNDVKVCSYISKDEAIEIFKSFSSGNNHQYLNKISWSKLIDIENETVDYVKSCVIQQAIKPELTYFIHEGRSMVPWMGFLKILSCDNIESDVLTEEFVESLRTSVTFRVLDDQTLYEYLKKIRKLQHFGNDLKYVSMEEIMDVLIKLGISVTSLPVTNEKNKIRLLPPIYLDQKILDSSEDSKTVVQQSQNMSSTTSESNPLPNHVLAAAGLKLARHNTKIQTNNNFETIPHSILFSSSSVKSECQSQSQSLSQSQSNHQPQNKLYKENTVFVYEVNGKDVIALPDIHKIIRKAQNLITSHAGAKSAQQRQVNYYLTKMRCKKGRFTFMQLKTIRKVGTPLGNATYCTFIDKEDAINLFKIYASLNMENPEVFQSIVFSEPISLGVENMIEIQDSSSAIDKQPYEIINADSLIDIEPTTDKPPPPSNKNIFTSLPEKQLLQFEVDKDLFRKYEHTRSKLKQMESQMAIITKYYKWKMRKVVRKNRYMKKKWRYLCQILDSMEDISETTRAPIATMATMDDIFIAQNGSSQN